MSTEQLIDLMHQALILSLLLAGPPLGFALAIGLFFAIFQAVTSIQEQSLIFVPKILVVIATLIVFMGWMTHLIVTFTVNVFSQMGSFAP